MLLVHFWFPIWRLPGSLVYVYPHDKKLPTKTVQCNKFNKFGKINLII
jgi:hypothetical protein